MAERRVGPDRLLLFGYAVFVVAAGARSVVQLSLHASRAPLAYALSAAAAVVYAAGFVLLRAATAGRLVRAARTACLVELSGVIAVGTAGLAWPTAFPDAAVWSGYGSGYGFVPVLLPVAALGWLHRWRVRPSPAGP